MTIPLTIQTAIETLGEEHTREILQGMWLDVLSQKAVGKGKRCLKIVQGHTIPPEIHHSPRKGLLKHLIDTSYEILGTDGFSKPEKWQNALYDATLYTPESDADHEAYQGLAPLTVGDLITELRDQRAARYCKLLNTFTLPEKAKVADIGVGSGGNWEKFLRENPEYEGYGLDPNYNPPFYPKKELDELPNYTHYQEAKDLPGNLDLISIGWIFHHAGDEENPTETHQQILDTAFEKLKPGGILVCMETLPATTIHKDADNAEQLAIAEAYLRDAVSSVGMLPGQPNNHVVITGHEEAGHWHDLITKAGFIVVEEKVISPDVDTFGETSVRYTLVKPMDGEEQQRALLTELCHEGAAVPFHY